MVIPLPLQSSKALILVILRFFSLHASGQADFKPGYIITLSNDTIRGFIDYKNNLVSSRQCTFKKTNDSEKEVYTPHTISGYRIADAKFYIAKTVKGERLFLEFLVDGIVNLYFHKTPSHAAYFLEKDTSLVELTNDKITGYRPTSQGFGQIKYENSLINTREI